MKLRPPSAGISLGSTSEVLNVMWLARRLAPTSVTMVNHEEIQ